MTNESKTIAKLKRQVQRLEQYHEENLRQIGSQNAVINTFSNRIVELEKEISELKKSK